LPTLKELRGITLGTEPVSSSNMRAFSGVQPNLYWSSSTSFTNATYAILVNMSNGFQNNDLKTDLSYVWPVRGKQ